MSSWYSRKAKGLCPRCGGPLENTKICRNCLDRLAGENFRLKMEVMRSYGGKCSCCGEHRPNFLSIDHINEDGAQHRKMFKHRGTSTAMYRWLRRNKYPAGFQVLCHNCNIGKTINGGVCPHVEERTSPESLATDCKPVRSGGSTLDVLE